MNLVNRGFLLVKPRKAFIELALSVNPSLLLDENAEGTTYLIEEEFWDDDLLIEKYAKKIWTQEFQAISNDNPELQLPAFSGNLNEFFSIELGCTVIDLLKDTITKEEL
ncbi:MAG: hypothetical protein ACKOWW_07500 [Flavobacteriales bacterium]